MFLCGDFLISQVCVSPTKTFIIIMLYHLSTHKVWEKFFYIVNDEFILVIYFRGNRLKRDGKIYYKSNHFC